ncbi:Sporulation kinase E [Fundidesulfovibrio magnetotacticus]|uniref:histidine kinase n=1 Tax=Fundidesulfovibrio magnetotacticus TaxID=2730080 RepID=A0A6V8LLR8_9BACT|nr:ATP-binding protein [Fundidesulfovibrio magnetotacticus]GFK93612.1 Sporulation kinase E [Fundidesulfovibrio magnetotacticus]
MSDPPAERPDNACALDLAQERNLLSSVIDQIPDDIVILDAQARVVDLNRAALDRLGGDREDFQGRSCWESLSGFKGICEPAADVEQWEMVRKGGRSEQVHTVVDHEGQLRYFRVYLYPVMASSGALSHVVVLRRDITQATSIERRLRQSEKLAAVGELSTYVAHEIRNPLFAIAGFANSLLRSGALDEKARAKVSIILEESGRLDKILKSLLNFSRPTQGMEGRFDASQVSSQTMELMGLGMQKQGIEATVDAAPGLPLAKGDPELVKQCIINMVKNSVEAMPEGGTLVLRCYGRADRVVIELEDSGRGIPPENLDQVFNPFFSTKDQGAGLGLAMTKKILDEIGGAVELESEVGKGTVVRLVLPPVTAAEDVDVQAHAAPRHDGLWRAGANNKEEA